MATFYNPYGGSNRSSGSGFRGYSPYSSGYGKPANTKFTAEQMLQLLKAKNTKHSQSFGDQIIHAGESGLHGVSWAFDKLLRPEYAVATAVDKGINGGIGGALHGAREGFMGRGDHGFGQVLSHHGVLQGHGTLRGLAGFGLDVAADPLTYLSGGTAALAKGAEHAALIKAGRLAISSTKISKDTHAGMVAARDVLKTGGDSYAARHALASHQSHYMAQILKGSKATELAKGTLASLREAAKAEETSVEKRLPHYSVGFAGKKIQITPTQIAGQRVVPALPKIANVAARGGLLGKSAQKFTDLFIRSPHETPVTHALGITHTHLAEQYTDAMIKAATKHFKSVPHLTEAQMLDALHHVEATKNAVIKTKHGSYILNIGHLTKLVREGKISPAQEKFIRAWHNATQELHKRDKSFGLDYAHVGEKGQVYVPHKLLDKLGHPLADAQVNKLTKAGFQHARSKAQFSVKMLQELSANGQLGREVETNPYNLLVHTIRQRATKQADMTTLHSIAGTMGTPTRLVDEARLAKNLGGQKKLTDKIAATQALHDAALSSAHTKEQLFLAEHELHHGNAMEALAAQLRSHKFGRNVPMKAANIGKINKRMAGVAAMHAQVTKDIAAGTHKGLNTLIGGDVAQAAAHAHDIANMNAELKRLGTVESRLRVGKKNKAYSTAQMKTVTGAVDSHGHPLAFKPEIAHAVEKYQKIVSGDDKAINDFSRGWSKWVANWKLGVTSVNPGYRIRNSMSDVWAMYIAGMPMHDVVTYGVKARNLMAAAKKGEPQAVETIKEAYHHGILSGLFQGDIQQVGKYIASRGKSYGAIAHDKKFLHLTTKIAQDANAHVENLGRITHYLYRRDKLGQSAADAAATVKKAHFDYEDLTPFEKRVMKNVAPFYTWTRKNIPFQLKALAEHPGRVMTFPKAAIESEQAAGGDKGNILPSFVGSGFGFQVPFGKHNYYLPQIGIADLQALDSKQGLSSRTLGLLNPAFKLPLELMMNKSTFTGQDIAGTHPRNPVSNLGADLLRLIPGSNVGQTSRLGPGGKQLSGPGANPYYAYMLQQLPWLNEALVKGQGSLKRGQAGGIPPELSQLLGQSVQHVDPALQQTIAQINLQDQAKKQMKGLRDEGVVPPAKHKVKKGGKADLINQVLASHAGRR
jgi:hypothetical protein